ncbi:MAG: BREX-1 system phosphatase PglZ type A, partial [Gammaproteobacteria bacterium]|nr:BREX-1 system phosphatase PglZ type A [Gammaproteobacteria bacterium]
MKAEQVDQALEQKFLSDGQRLVFWHDGAGEFAGYIDSGLPDELSEVQILELAQVGGLSAKLKLEREDSVGKYLIYSQGQQPQAEEDWLLDIRLYSTEFHADIASIWLQELGLSGLYLRDHLKARSRFMANQERRRKLSRLIDAGDDEDGIDLKMMAVLVGSQEPSRATVLRSLCHGHVVDGRFNLEATPQAIEAFHKMDLLPQFWNFVQQEFGYQAERPSLAGLLRRLLISELFYQTDNATISALAHHQLPAAGRSNAVVFLTHWRDSSIHAASYDATAMAVAKEQKVELAMETLGLEAIQQVFTFWPAEQLVLSGLKDRVLSEKESLDLAGLKAVVGERQSGHWLAGPGRDLSGRQAAFEAYNAILAAAELFDLYQTHRQRLKFDSAEALLQAYQQDLYRFDHLYRRFCSQADASTDQGWDLLKTLAEEVDRIYIQGFLQPLGIEWSRLLDQGFLKRWSMAGMPGQQTFFTKTIRPHLKQSDRKRAFVIISDAFRYEAAKQLNQELNGRYRMRAELSSMLGVLPSYTALGMASLLPHQTLTYNPAGEVLLDGKSVAGTEARSQQLATVEGMACQAR